MGRKSAIQKRGLEVDLLEVSNAEICSGGKEILVP
jgi:hypothetical protein